MKGQKSPLLWALVASVALHLSFIGVFLLPSEQPPLSSPPPVQVEFVELPGKPVEKYSQGEKASKAKGQSDSAASPTDRPSQKNLAGFLPDYDFNESTQSPPLPKAPDPPPVDRANAINHVIGSTLESSLDQQSYYQALAQKLYAHLDYPKQFVELGVRGEVAIPLIVDERGIFQGFQYEMSGSSKALTTYALASVFASLKSPLPQKLWQKSGRYPINIKIDFDIDTMRVRRSSVRVQGTIVDIKRVTYADSWLNRRMGEIIDRYFPPVFPIPGGFAVDFIRLYKMIKAWNDPSPEVMRQERLTLLVETLEQSVREAKKEAHR